jgi:hypothetical protein
VQHHRNSLRAPIQIKKRGKKLFKASAFFEEIEFSASFARGTRLAARRENPGKSCRRHSAFADLSQETRIIDPGQTAVMVRPCCA